MTPEFQTDGVFDIYKMLDIIRQRPAMYLREESLTNLWWLITGYRWALQDNDVPYKKVEFWNFSEFHNYVHKRLNLPSTADGYAFVILKYCNGNEAKALAKFFELLDEFRQQEN